MVDWLVSSVHINMLYFEVYLRIKPGHLFRLEKVPGAYTSLIFFINLHRQQYGSALPNTNHGVNDYPWSGFIKYFGLIAEYCNCCALVLGSIKMKKMIRNLSVLILLVLFISSCSNHVAQVSEEEITKEIITNWEGFIDSWEKEDAAGCASFYMKDGLNIPPGFKINEGRKAVEDFYDFLFEKNLSSKYQHDIDFIDVLTDSTLIEKGGFQVDWVRNDSTEWTFKARTVTSWKKDEAGNWKIALFIFNNPPAD
jgi:uncharacterized protein (TIGR02246 family)